MVDFFVVQHKIPYHTIQPCPLGQEYVCFSYMHHRDLLINGGPYHYGNDTISFIPHNKAWNNRSTVMTHEVWFALLGLNLDLWTHSLVDKAVSESGKLIVWEEDHDNMARVLVKARVVSLDAIPWFFTFTEGDDPESVSWTMQCEVFHASLLGAVAQDEDFPLDDDDDIQPENFDFFGFGQPR